MEVVLRNITTLFYLFNIQVMMKKVYVEIMNFKKILFLLALLFISVINQAQEVNCGDGIDNDGDGLIDCYDSECYNSSECDNPLADCNTVGDPVNSRLQLVHNVLI